MNDYMIRIRDLDEEQITKSKGRHFQICFNLDQNKYFIKDLANGFGSFLKIENETVIVVNQLLKNNALINIGDSYIVVNIGDINEDLSKSNNHSLGDTEISAQIHFKIFSGVLDYEPM